MPRLEAEVTNVTKVDDTSINEITAEYLHTKQTSKMHAAGMEDREYSKRGVRISETR